MGNFIFSSFFYIYIYSAPETLGRRCRKELKERDQGGFVLWCCSCNGGGLCSLSGTREVFCRCTKLLFSILAVACQSIMSIYYFMGKQIDFYWQMINNLYSVFCEPACLDCGDATSSFWNWKSERGEWRPAAAQRAVQLFLQSSVKLNSASRTLSWTISHFRWRVPVVAAATELVASSIK